MAALNTLYPPKENAAPLTSDIPPPSSSSSSTNPAKPGDPLVAQVATSSLPPPYTDPTESSSPPPSAPTPSSSPLTPRGGLISNLLSSPLPLDDSETLSAFPLTLPPGGGGNPVHTNIEFKVLKNIKDAATNYGLHSPYTKGILESLVSGNTVMLLYDWKMLFSMLMTPAQYVVWQSEYEKCVDAEMRRGLPAAVTESHLKGTGQFATLAQQQNCPRRAFAIIHMCAMNALKRVDDTDSQSTQAFLKVMQNSDESYASFISRLQTALDRQIDNATAKQELLMKLAFSNANHDCQKILQPVANKPGVTLAEFLQLCRIVGTTTHKMDALAAAISSSLPTSASSPDAFTLTRNGNCFNCGKPGHFKNQCRLPGGGGAPRGQARGPPSPGPKAKPKTICPRCRKGFHWASQCRSSPPSAQPSGN